MQAFGLTGTVPLLPFLKDPLPERFLRLSDGTRWSIRGDRNSRSWIESLVSIMHLGDAIEGDTGGVECRLQIARPRNGWKPGGGAGLSPDLTEKKLNQANVPDEFEDFSPTANWQCLDFKTLRIWHQRNSNVFFCEVAAEEDQILRYITLWRCLYPIYLRAIQNGGVPFHGALVVHGNNSYLLAGQGGIGKSTACSRLPLGWTDCCDDETLVVRAGRRCYHAHPFPTWSEYIYQRSQKSWDVQTARPLRALFFIEQSPDDWVQPIGSGEAVGLINRSVLQTCKRFFPMLEEKSRRRLSLEIFANACEMARSLPAYRMGMTLTGRFWEMMLDAVGES